MPDVPFTVAPNAMPVVVATSTAPVIAELKASMPTTAVTTPVTSAMKVQTLVAAAPAPVLVPAAPPTATTTAVVVATLRPATRQSVAGQSMLAGLEDVLRASGYKGTENMFQVYSGDPGRATASCSHGSCTLHSFHLQLKDEVLVEEGYSVMVWGLLGPPY